VKKVTTPYPRITQIGLAVYEEPCAHVKWEEMDAALAAHRLDRKRFGELFGVQTVCAHGPYSWDVEAVLERMMSGRRTGTQILWD
jgi:hypothetical protein